MTPYTPKQLRRIERTLHPVAPAYRRQNHGLWALAEARGVSYASLRAKVLGGMSREEAVKYCLAEGLKFIPRGTTNPCYRRKAKKPIP